MAIEQDAAIVLRSFPYGEADRILLLGTPRFGKLRVIAKGARRPKSRFGASAQPFQIGQAVFYLKPTREIQLLSAFETTEPLSGRMGDPLRLAYASYFSELAEAALVEGEPNPRLFEMICAAFRTLSETEKGAVLQTLARAVELKLLAMTGHRPQLDRCVLCGAEPAGAQRVAISPSLGGGICASHRASRSVRTIGLETVRWAETLLKARFIEVENLPRPSTRAQNELKRLLREMILFHWEIRLRTAEYLDALEEEWEGFSAPLRPGPHSLHREEGS